MNRTVVVAALGTAQTLAWASSYYLPAILADPIAQGPASRTCLAFSGALLLWRLCLIKKKIRAIICRRSCRSDRDGTGVSRAVVFGIFSGSLLLSAVFGPAVGRAIDQRGGRGVLAISNVVLAAGLVLLGLSHEIFLLSLAWFVLGIGMAMGLYDPAFATLTGLYGRAARGPITGITLIAGFASTVGWPLSAFLEAHYGWRETCFIWAALHIVMGLPLNRLLIPPAPPPLRSKAEGEAPPAPRWAMPILAFVFAATAFVTGAMAAHLPRLLEIAGASATVAIAASALVGPAQVGARLIEFGALAGRPSAGLGTALDDPASDRCGGPGAVRTRRGHGLCGVARRRQRSADDRPRDRAARDLRADRLRPAHRIARRASARDASVRAISVRPVDGPDGRGFDRDFGRPVPVGVPGPFSAQSPRGTGAGDRVNSER